MCGYFVLTDTKGGLLINSCSYIPVVCFAPDLSNPFYVLSWMDQDGGVFISGLRKSVSYFAQQVSNTSQCECKRY